MADAQDHAGLHNWSACALLAHSAGALAASVERPVGQAHAGAALQFRSDDDPWLRNRHPRAGRPCRPQACTVARMSCRLCGSSDLHEALSLGTQYINDFVTVDRIGHGLAAPLSVGAHKGSSVNSGGL